MHTLLVTVAVWVGGSFAITACWIAYCYSFDAVQRLQRTRMAMSAMEQQKAM
jgi:hypothetical protein